VGADGLARTPDGAFVRLDVPRCWALVKALMTSPHSDVAWLFVASHVEALIIEHARAAGEPDWLVWRAESVMHQPGDSTPHDDHFHLRIACTADEAIAGCVSGGPDWPWLPRAPSLTADLATLVDEG
jgi:penicillin-insensitive murein endopeptidase